MRNNKRNSILFIEPRGQCFDLMKTLAKNGKFKLYTTSTNNQEIEENITVLENQLGNKYDIVVLAPELMSEKNYREILDESSLIAITGNSPVPFSSIVEKGLMADYKTLLGLRIICDDSEIKLLEFVRLPSTNAETLDLLSQKSQDFGISISILEYDIPGGAAERIRVSLESELWKMVREGIASPGAINKLSRENFGLEAGFLDQIRTAGPELRAKVDKQLYITSMNDGRFRPEYDQFPADMGENWDALTALHEHYPPPAEDNPPKNILVIGTPHLVDLWCDKIYKCTKAAYRPKGIKLWDLGSLTESVQKEIADGIPYDLVMEVLIAPTEERQKLLELLVGVTNENSQFWLHTLNTPATVTVQVIPEQISAIGFSGLPGFYDSCYCEFSKPKNSKRTEFNKAKATAFWLGLRPVEVADEPGGVIPRLLATMVNSTSFLAREGIVSSEIEGDRIAAKTLAMENGPLVLADIYGLDTIEAVLIGLYAFNGIDRYRVSPFITMRIESGALGNITDKGYYRV